MNILRPELIRQDRKQFSRLNNSKAEQHEEWKWDAEREWERRGERGREAIRSRATALSALSARRC